MSNTRYYALLDGKKGAYGVIFPDLPGCCAMGATHEEAIDNAIEAMNDWMSDMGSPTPRNYDELIADEDVQEHLGFGSTFLIIDSSISSLSVPLFTELDQKALALGVSRTSYMAQALRNEMARATA